MRRLPAPRMIAAISITTLVASCSPIQEEEFDQYEAMERISTADLIGELVDRAAVNHSSKWPVTEVVGGIVLRSPSDQPRFGAPENTNSKVGVSEEPVDYLGDYENFATLFQSSHDGDADASLAISHFYAHNEKARNLVLAMMYLKLANVQSAGVTAGHFEELNSQMSTFEIGLSDRAFEFCSIENGVVEGDFASRVFSDCHFQDWDGERLDISVGISPNPFSGLNAEDLEE